MRTIRQRRVGAIGGLLCLAAAMGALGAVGVPPPAAADDASACQREVTFHIHAAGDDSVDVCDGTIGSFDRLRAARAVAVSLDVDPNDAYDDDYYSVATVQLDGHLPQPEGEAWRFDFDTDGLQTELAHAGFDDFSLRLCPPKPPVDVRLDADPEPNRISNRCATWFLEPEGQPVSFTLRLLPDEDDYWRPVAVAGAVTAGMTVVALLLAWWLRKGPLQHRTAASFLAAAAALFVGLVAAVALALFLFISGATSEFVLDNDREAGYHFLAATGPGAVLMAPFLLFAGIVLAAPGRPHSERAPQWSRPAT